MTGHFIPVGRYRGRPIEDVPADYLLWYLRTCKPSTGLRAAIRAELIRRGTDPADLPPEPPPKPAPECRRCGGRALVLRWQELNGGARTIRGECKQCGRFVTFVAQTDENVRLAGGDRPAVKTGSDAIRFPSAPPPPTEVVMPPLSRGDFPPDWRAAYVRWGVEARRQMAGDPKALEVLEACERLLWRAFEEEVEGQSPDV